MGASFAHAHISLKTPKTFVFDGDGETNPYAKSGSDFPCRVKGYTINGERTVMAVGEPQTATFSGSATHTGGSCQFALSKDLKPTAQSSWQVIHSVEGGCPGRQAAGYEPGAYNFTIPAGFAPGDYTFIWTWVARATGEFYGECAPITVTAPRPAKRASPAERRRIVVQRDQSPAFPELFMASLGELTGSCQLVANQISIAYPIPGASVEYGDGDAAKLYKQPCDGNPRAHGSSGSAGGSNGGSKSSTVSGGVSRCTSATSDSTKTSTTAAACVRAQDEPKTVTTTVTIRQ